MVEVYVRLIQLGRKTIDEVPKIIDRTFSFVFLIDYLLK